MDTGRRKSLGHGVPGLAACRGSGAVQEEGTAARAGQGGANATAVTYML